MIPRPYILPLLGLALSVALFAVGHYQLEIIYIAIQNGWGQFDMPFYLWSTTNFALARDIFYGVNALGFILLGVSIYTLSATRVRRRLN